MDNTKPLRKNRDFIKVYKKGNFFVGKLMVIYVLKNKSDINKLGVTTIKNYGNSVERNRIRRLIKENYRLLENEVITGWDIVFSARKTDRMPEYKEIQKEMKYLLRRTGLFK